jgi:hypothetical protein
LFKSIVFFDAFLARLSADLGNAFFNQDFAALLAPLPIFAASLPVVLQIFKRVFPIAPGKNVKIISTHDLPVL